MPGLKLLFLVASFAAAFASENATAQTIELRWNCNLVGQRSNIFHALQQELAAPSRIFTIPENLVATWRRFLDTRFSANEIDLFPCLNDFEDRLDLVLSQAVSDAVREPIMAEIRAMDAAVNERAFRSQGTLPLIPMTPLADYPPEAREAQLADRQTVLSEASHVTDFLRDHYNGVCLNLSQVGNRSGQTNYRLLFSREYIMHALPEYLFHSSRECQALIFQEYLQMLAPLQQTEAQCPNSVARCRAMRQGSIDLIHALISNFDPDLRVSYSNIPGACDTNQIPFNELNYFMRSIRQSTLNRVSQCSPLNPGESVDYFSSRDQGTGLPASYRLSRRIDGSHEIALHVVLSNIDRSDSQRAWETYIQRCVQEYETRIQGTPNQIHLNINPRGLGTSVHSVRVEFTGTNGAQFRSHSEAWAQNLDCPTMIHELFHLAGAPDLYPERWRGYNRNAATSELVYTETTPDLPWYNCRRFGPVNGLMRDQWAAFNSVARNSPEHREGFFSPAEFRALTLPGCISANRVFYLCARESQRTTRDRRGEGCTEHLPEECRDQNSTRWLGYDH